MKKLLLLSVVCFIATGISATDLSPYVEGRFNSTHSKSRINDAEISLGVSDHNIWGGSLAVGSKFENFRVELEGAYNGKGEKKVNNRKSELQTKGFFINGYYDLANTNGFTPFIGAGIGYSWL